MLGEMLPEPLRSTLCPLSGPFPACATICTCHIQTALRKGLASSLLMSPRSHAEVWTVKQVWNLKEKRFWMIRTNTNPKKVQSNEIFPSLLRNFQTALNADCCHWEDARDFNTRPKFYSGICSGLLGAPRKFCFKIKHQEEVAWCSFHYERLTAEPWGHRPGSRCMQKASWHAHDIKPRANVREIQKRCPQQSWDSPVVSPRALWDFICNNAP